MIMCADVCARMAEAGTMVAFVTGSTPSFRNVLTHFAYNKIA